MGRMDVSPDSPFYDLSQYPARTAEVKTFWMDQTEVTNEEYASFVRETKYAAPTNWINGAPRPGEEKWPVTMVSLNDAKAFAAWRSRRDGKNYRLPREDEWEYAARNGSQSTLYPWGNEWLNNYANVDSKSLKPVGSYPPSPSARWQVKDLIGNAWEWTSTEAAPYGSNPLKLKIPKGQFVIRGGAYLEPHSGPEAITATRRTSFPPSTKDEAIGFRLVLDGP